MFLLRPTYLLVSTVTVKVLVIFLWRCLLNLPLACVVSDKLLINGQLAKSLRSTGLRGLTSGHFGGKSLSARRGASGLPNAGETEASCKAELVTGACYPVFPGF